MIEEETYTPSCQVPFLKDVFQPNWGGKKTGNPGNRGFYPGEQQEAPPDGCCVVDLRVTHLVQVGSPQRDAPMRKQKKEEIR